MSAPPRVLAIAGSDSSGGAGIQADLKTIAMLGGYGMTAITAITAQNTRGVQAVVPLSAELVEAQIESCLSDIGADAIKIGMLGSPAIAHVVARLLKSFSGSIVFDPVMVATSGGVLADDDTIAAFAPLMDIATLVTPNLPELTALTGMPVGTHETVAAAAHMLVEQHSCAVLAKGGHAEGDRVLDMLVLADGDFANFDDPRIETRHTHGTGCTLSSAVATLLAHGQPLTNAVRLARRFVRAAIEHAPGFGDGSGPLGHQAVRTLT